MAWSRHISQETTGTTRIMDMSLQSGPLTSSRVAHAASCPLSLAMLAAILGGCTGQEEGDDAGYVLIGSEARAMGYSVELDGKGVARMGLVRVPLEHTASLRKGGSRPLELGPDELVVVDGEDGAVTRLILGEDVRADALRVDAGEEVAKRIASELGATARHYALDGWMVEGESLYPDIAALELDDTGDLYPVALGDWKGSASEERPRWLAEPERESWWEGMGDLFPAEPRNETTVSGSATPETTETLTLCLLDFSLDPMPRAAFRISLEGKWIHGRTDGLGKAVFARPHLPKTATVEWSHWPPEFGEDGFLGFSGDFALVSGDSAGESEELAMAMLGNLGFDRGSLRSSVEEFQRTFHLPITGNLDATTIGLIDKKANACDESDPEGT